VKRIIIHWTAGGAKASGLDRVHYHFLVQQDGAVVPGTFKPEANLAPKPGAYAAHTRNCNTGSIGVAVCGMMGAQERPFKPGPAPITWPQVTIMCSLVASLCDEYRIAVTRETVLTHAEVQPTLKIAQLGKWDICWLPGWDAPRDAVATGDALRRDISAALALLKGA
jgi:N-acetyl-anhydromuramyl-L-alanine amidase AmpD